MNTDLSKYKGLSDFLLNAPKHVQGEFFREVALKANEEQRRIFEENNLKNKKE